MDSNDAAKDVGQSAGSHRERLFMVWKYGASGDENRASHLMDTC